MFRSFVSSYLLFSDLNSYNVGRSTGWHLCSILSCTSLKDALCRVSATPTSCEIFPPIPLTISFSACSNLTIFIGTRCCSWRFAPDREFNIKSLLKMSMFLEGLCVQTVSINFNSKNAKKYMWSTLLWSYISSTPLRELLCSIKIQCSIALSNCNNLHCTCMHSSYLVGELD